MSKETEEKLQAHLATAEVIKVGRSSYREPVSRIVCGDGTTLSFQASENHYCSPRSNEGPWSAVEVGFPSRKLDDLRPYAEEWDNPTSTVYGHVPLALLADVVDKCGGFAGPVVPLTGDHSDDA